jgi:hypothetical protein
MAGRSLEELSPFKAFRPYHLVAQGSFTLETDRSADSFPAYETLSAVYRTLQAACQGAGRDYSAAAADFA